MKKLFLVGARSRYTHELQEILSDSNRGTGVPVDNLEDKQYGVDSGFVQLRSLREEEGAFLLCPSPGAIRFEISLQMKSFPLQVEPALAHPHASLASSVVLGAGTTINRLVAISAHSKLGSHVQVNRGSSIGHDCLIHDFVTIGPGVTIASGVMLMRGAFIGAGATLLPGVSVGANAIIGAGSVVLADVPDFATVVGSPGRVIKIGSVGHGGSIAIDSTTNLFNSF